MNTDVDRKIVNFLDEFEQEQKIINDKYGDFNDGQNILRRRSEEPDPLEESKLSAVKSISI